MKAIIIERGTYRFGVIHLKTAKSTPPEWAPNPDGGSVCIADVEDYSPIEANNGTLVHVVQRNALMNIIAERLNLPPAEDLPDIRKIAAALKADSINICEYCSSLDCRMCELNEESFERAGENDE